MSRRLLAFILTICICWHSLSFAGVGSVLTNGDEQRHEQLHFEGTPHHHGDHDDGDVHQDGSDASVNHVTMDAGLFAPALTSAIALSVLEQLPERPKPAAMPAATFTFMDGLERPPRLTA